MSERIVISGRLREEFEKHVAERCAPLVEFAEEVADEPLAGPYRVLARAALAAYHAAQGAGRET